MSGSVCPLEELCDIAHKYGALTFIDEVRHDSIFAATLVIFGSLGGKYQQVAKLFRNCVPYDHNASVASLKILK